VDLVKKDNFDKYSLEKLVEYWKNKAQKRWEKLNSENRLKEGLEVYSIEKIEQMDYDMIR